MKPAHKSALKRGLQFRALQSGVVMDHLPSTMTRGTRRKTKQAWPAASLSKVLGNMVRTQMPLHTCKVNLRLATHSQHSPDNEQDDGLAHKVLPATMRKVRSSQTPDIAVDRVEGRQGDPCPRGQAQEHV